MSLLYVGDTTFQQTGKEIWIPTPFELDQLVVNMEGGFDDLDAFLDDLEVGQESDIDNNMLLQRWRPSYPRPGVANVEMTYLGPKGGVMPSAKHDKGGDIRSATTNTDSDIFPSTVTNPATVEFYAPTTSIRFATDNPAATDEPDDPRVLTTADIITWDLGNGLQPGLSFPDLVYYLLNNAFVQGIIETPPDVEEVLPGQFWMITKRKTRTLFPYAPPS